MKKNITYYFIALALLFSTLVKAQVFPVNAMPQVIPPYSLKLSEYSTATTDKIFLNLLLTDITESNRQVRLKLYIENNAGLSVQSNDVVIGAPPIFLDGGVPLRLSNLDLQPYFALQNLRGISPQLYSRPLPEGLYGFCFEVYDALSGRQISRKSCARVYLALANPPFLIMPERGEQVVIKNPQNIFFNWSPGTPAGTRVEYEFTLTELWDDQMDPQAAFLASRPLYQTTTTNNVLLYGPAEPQLLPNKKYGWRIKATATDGISETSVFKNDGYSEIFHFTYSDTCKEPEFVLSESKGPTSEKILWQGVDHERFNVQYRKKDVENAIWFESSTVNQYTTIYNLEPGTTYEFRVGGECLENSGYVYSQIYEFTTIIPGDGETSTYNCGITPEIVITNQDPLETLVINDVFTAGDFPVTVKSVTGGNTTVTDNPLDDVQGGTGSYSGWGYIVVPYLEDTKLKVNFEGIGINTDYQLISGIVYTDYDENWGGVNDISDELDALLNFDLNSLTSAIIEALNLDIDKVTKENTKLIADAIVENGTIEQLPDELQARLNEASDRYEDSGARIESSREAIENATTDEEKEKAEEELKDAIKDFKEAQSDLGDINEEIEKEKGKLVDLIIKAIYELYRGYNDNKDAISSNYRNANDVLSENTLALNNISSGNGATENIEFDAEMTSFEMLDNGYEINSSDSFIESYNNYLEKESELFNALIIENFVSYISSDKIPDDVLNLLKSESKEMLDQIKVLNDDEASDRVIIDYIKEALPTIFDRLIKQQYN